VVTGGAGFIGSHLVDALLGRGARVHVIDNLATGQRERVNPAAELHEIDVADVDALIAFAHEHGPIARWYHLAAQADVRVSVDRPLFDARTNVLGTIAVLEAATLHQAQVVFSSTGGAMYGETQPPTPESAREQPESPYGAAKLAAEKYIEANARLNSLPHAIVRFANVYGPRQDPHGEAGVVAIFGGIVLAGQRARIFGNGTQTRDYVYVGDVVDVTLRAGEFAQARSQSEWRNVPIWNVGTGTETSVLELWTAIQRVEGVDLGADFHPARAGELDRSALDSSMARDILAAPIDTSLDSGLARTIDWMRERAQG